MLDLQLPVRQIEVRDHYLEAARVLTCLSEEVRFHRAIPHLPACVPGEGLFGCSHSVFCHAFLEDGCHSICVPLATRTYEGYGGLRCWVGMGCGCPCMSLTHVGARGLARLTVSRVDACAGGAPSFTSVWVSCWGLLRSCTLRSLTFTGAACAYGPACLLCLSSPSCHTLRLTHHCCLHMSVTFLGVSVRLPCGTPAW